MKTTLASLILCCIIFAACSNSEKYTPAEYPIVYDSNWESLEKNNKEPDWFADAKLGIYFHWGPYSVPAFDSEWYPRWMYVPDRKSWGSKVFKHHQDTWGPATEFNYHDFVPMFKAENFDARNWAQLFEDAGAKFAGPVAQHHDGFAMWDSEVNPWNAMDKGPKKDILGDLFAELKKRDMKTIATFHHARTLQRNAKDTANWQGSNSHFPYHPDYATSTTDPELKYLYGNIPAEEFHEYWLHEVTEVVDKYAPDIIWFDSWLDKIPENYRQKMVAHQFNAGAARDQQTLVVYKQKDIPRNVGVLDIEQGGMKDMSPDYWMTDITLSYKSWCYIQDQTYKELPILLRNMIDVWSKKGVVLLNISPRADGVIVEEQRKVLGELGAWLKKYGEAVYGTRTHSIYGYGDAELAKGHFGGVSATNKYSASDIRFTAANDGSALYVFFLGLPDANKTIKLKHVLDTSGKTVKSVSLVGSNAAVDWKVKESILELVTPDKSEMNDVATVFKVEWNK